MAARTTFLDRILRPLRGVAETRETLVFAPDFLAQLERLRVAALKALGGGLREGHRLGAYKGGQLEFHGHRDYSPGDELRYLDWNSYARLGRPYIKEFAREESGVLHIIIDATASMGLGKPAKYTFARRVAALFAHVALASKDSVHTLIFGGAGRADHFPARRAKMTTQDFLVFLENARLDEEVERSSRSVQGKGLNGAGAPFYDLRAAVSDFLKRGPRRGGVLLLGDFWQEEQEITESVSRLAQAGFDVSAIHTLAAEELNPPAQGELLVRSVESGTETALWFGAALSARYGEELEKHRAAVEGIIRRRGGNYLFAPSDTSIEKVLIASLRQRRWLL